MCIGDGGESDDGTEIHLVSEQNGPTIEGLSKDDRRERKRTRERDVSVCNNEKKRLERLMDRAKERVSGDIISKDVLVTSVRMCRW